MLARIYETLTSKTFEIIDINSISELSNVILERETLSKYADKVQSVNLFLFKKIDDYTESSLEFSWLDVDGKNHEGVGRDSINKAIAELIKLKIPFLVFRTQHENCYKIICQVSYKNGMLIQYDEYRQINEKFQKHIFSICGLKDYEDGSCSPTKGFCLSKNGIKVFNENEKPFNITFEYEPPVRQLTEHANYSFDQKSEKEKFEFALNFITTDICSTFEEWTNCAMAINKEFGDAGLGYFQTISKYYSGRQSDAEVDAKYKHCKNSRSFSIGTVYHLIEKAGIEIDWKSFYTETKKATIKKQPKPKSKDLAKRFDDLENSYYFKMHSFFSIPEFYELIESTGLEKSKYKLEYDKLNYVTVRKDGVDLSINQVFADKWDFFTKLCTEKHFALYQDVLNDKFSFNFTAEEMTAWLTEYPMTIFRNFEYNRAAHAITPTVENADHFDIDRTVKAKIENLFESSLNIQEKKFKNFKLNLDASLSTFKEDFELRQEIIPIKNNNGWIDAVIERGSKYIANHPGSSVVDQSSYWMDSLASIFSIDENDYFSIISFIVNSIRVRLYGEMKSMRALILTGDSGIGKDSFWQGVLTGLNYKKADEYILRGSLRGATGFSVASEREMKRIMYNYISDDLSSANNSTDLNTISDPRLPLEIKGNTQKYIPKRFNSVITNNKPGVIFGKEKDHNAIARRFNFCEVKYAKGCDSTDYIKFYTHFDEKLDDYWAGFFTFCFELEKYNNQVEMLNIKSRQYTLDNLHKLFYKKNDDNRILDMLLSFYEREIKLVNDVSLLEKNECIKYIKEKPVLIIKSVANYCKTDNMLSGEKIKTVVAAHIEHAKIDSSYRDLGMVRRAAIMIPCSYFAQDSENDDAENGFAQIKTDLIENFKKYV